MHTFIVKVTYRVPAYEAEEPKDLIEKVEAQRWEMFQEKYGVEPLELVVEEVSNDS